MTRDWKAEAVKQWDSDPCGAVWDVAFGSPAFFSAVERERYVKYAPWLPGVMGFDRHAGQRVLEVGVGLGTDHISFARGGARTFGIDLTPSHVGATKRRFALEGMTPRLGRADAESLPFAADVFDVVYSFGVLHHTPRIQTAVDEIYRVLRPGGEAIVGLYHRDSAFFWWSCVLTAGIVRGGFLREGYRRTLSRVERRAHSDAVPLVKVYGRRSSRRLFRRFVDVRIGVHHFRFDESGRLGRLLKSVMPCSEEWLARRIGWYLVISARKPR